MPILRFGVFEVDPDSGELRKRGFRIRLREQPLRLLLTLIEQAGRVVTREQLRHRLWPDGTFVDFDRAINKATSELRGALGDSASSPRFVETLSKRGYRFVCPVECGPRAPRGSTSAGFPLMCSEHASRGDISGAEEPSAICIRALDSSRMRWKSMIGARLPTQGWQTRTCWLPSGGFGRLISHSVRLGVLPHARSS